MSKLIEFYGEECPNCIAMKDSVEKLEKEMGVQIEKFEVWHAKENLKKYEELEKGRCGGVPFFVNTETDAFICGAATFEELVEWAGEKA